MALATASLVVGVADLGATALFTGRLTQSETETLLTSRIPRTIALVLCGASLAVGGLVMQLLTRNPFVEPATAGTMEFAGLGLLGALLLTPDASLSFKMLLGTVAALLGTAAFIRILGAVPQSDILSVPLLGLMLGGVVAAASTFIAYRADLLQSLGSWMTGDFSVVLAGRYELLWAAGVATCVVVLLADRFTVAGLGADVATSLGVNHARTLALGLSIVAVVTATIVVTVGMLPFIGLVVPNVVSRFIGGNARRSIPWVALLGVALVLACDLCARLLVHPYELPIGTIMAVVGGAAFIVLLLKGPHRGR
ncbi:MAG: iron chelate uptake ABC transporter family permease subunit [Intrasporangium sp.]|uniref:ABC transporter permease n=1 Tax=Intrasporangium sp. TaxID=1925024 RepID=UPI0026493F81|nr:iron chelate uptake ABC transporter family permease subunit [Intrasporangium sp.]MDN5797795.1 iron chelate uptake ABC transporter family permease subunit [Intrasporangium sp.]